MSELEGEGLAPEAPAPEEPSATVEEPWSGPAQEDWEATQQALQYLVQQVAPPQPQPTYEQSQPIELDPLDPSFQQQLDQYLEQKFAPYSQFQQTQQQQEGEARAKDVLADLSTRDGEFNTDHAYEVGIARYKEAARQHGASWELLENVLAQTAKDVRAFEEAAGKAYHERQINQVQGLAGARGEPGAAGNAGSQQFVFPEGGGLLDVVKRHVNGSY